MGRLLAEVIPLALGAAISPVVLLLGVGLMTRPRPLLLGTAFAAGAALPVLAVSAAVLAFGAAIDLSTSGDLKAILDLALGAVLLLLGLRALLRPAPPAPKEPKPEPAVSPARAFALGAGAMATNVTTIALLVPAMKLISESTVPTDEKAVAAALVIVITLSLVLVPLAVVLLAPHASARVLGRLGELLTAHRRTVSLVLLLGFGAWLAIRGIAGL